MSEQKSFRIIQIGCGIVGKAYVTAYENAGCQVIGIEANKDLVEKYKESMREDKIFET